MIVFYKTEYLYIYYICFKRNSGDEYIIYVGKFAEPTCVKHEKQRNTLLNRVLRHASHLPHIWTARRWYMHFQVSIRTLGRRICNTGVFKRGNCIQSVRFFYLKISTVSEHIVCMHLDCICASPPVSDTLFHPRHNNICITFATLFTTVARYLSWIICLCVYVYMHILHFARSFTTQCPITVGSFALILCAFVRTDRPVG